ncbi:MAG: helix-turn-helix domain-containing protein [Saprospiraceae bacterium]|nr:helix-turn-helix domain-containing protein [Saprospiraceae bacterium]
MKLRQFLLFFNILCIWLPIKGQQCSKIHFATTHVQVDGNLEEWTPDIRFADRGEPKYRNRALAGLCWDKENLYIAFEVRDARLCVNERGMDNPKLYFSDGVEMYIDTKHDSKGRLDLNDYQFLISIGNDMTVFKGDRAMQMNGDRVPKDYEASNLILPHDVICSGTINEAGDVDKGYTIEIAIPWNSIGLVPLEGTKLKLDLCINDVDTISQIRFWPDSLHPSSLNYYNLDGEGDFGFPQKWRSFELEGSEGFSFSLSRFLHTLPMGFWIGMTLLVAGLLFFVYYQYTKILFYRNFPAKKSITESIKAVEANATEMVDATFLATVRNHVHADKEISVAELAKSMNRSVRQLQRDFKDATTLTPHQLITTIKLEEAAILLMESELTAAEVALRCGFSEPSYFGSVFKKYFGVSPLEYRRLKRRQDASGAAI